MFALSLTDDAELRQLMPWHADEFLANLDRCREHIAPWVGASFVATDAGSARRRRVGPSRRPSGRWRNLGLEDEDLRGEVWVDGWQCRWSRDAAARTGA